MADALPASFTRSADDLPPAPPRRWPSKVRGWLRRAAIATCFVLPGAAWPRVEVPLALIGLGGLLHFLAKGYLVRRKRITREGPYRWVRHPFYLANLLLETGLLLFAGAWWAVPVYLLVAHFAYNATMDEEESDLAAVHGEAWREYAAAVPRILPHRGPCPRGDGPGFSFLNLVYEREIPRLMRLLSLPLGITWWRAWLALEGPYQDRTLLPDALSAKCFVLFVGLQLSSWFLAALLRAPRMDGRPRFPPRE